MIQTIAPLLSHEKNEENEEDILNIDNYVVSHLGEKLICEDFKHSRDLWKEYDRLYEEFYMYLTRPMMIRMDCLEYKKYSANIKKIIQSRFDSANGQAKFARIVEIRNSLS